MGYYTDIVAGVGAMLGGGFLTLESGVMANIGLGAGFGTALPLVLYAAGFIFLGAGIVERFFTSQLLPKANAEAVAKVTAPVGVSS